MAESIPAERSFPARHFLAGVVIVCLVIAASAAYSYATLHQFPAPPCHALGAAAAAVVLPESASAVVPVVSGVAMDGVRAELCPTRRLRQRREVQEAPSKRSLRGSVAALLLEGSGPSRKNP